MNARPGPPLTSSQVAPAGVETRKPRVANTPMPARTSNAELEKPTTRPELVRFDLRLRYEEYVSMMPKPTDSEKKIWP